ncbi:MAG: hypothetical protein RL215_1994, partial [Planctomycetota bacterium]
PTTPPPLYRTRCLSPNSSTLSRGPSIASVVLHEWQLCARSIPVPSGPHRHNRQTRHYRSAQPSHSPPATLNRRRSIEPRVCPQLQARICQDPRSPEFCSTSGGSAITRCPAPPHRIVRITKTVAICKIKPYSRPTLLPCTEPSVCPQIVTGFVCGSEHQTEDKNAKNTKTQLIDPADTIDTVNGTGTTRTAKATVVFPQIPPPHAEPGVCPPTKTGLVCGPGKRNSAHRAATQHSLGARHLHLLTSELPNPSLSAGSTLPTTPPLRS